MKLPAGFPVRIGLFCFCSSFEISPIVSAEKRFRVQFLSLSFFGMSRGELLLRGALRDIPKSGCKGNYIRFCENLDFSMFIICKLCQFIFSHPCFFLVYLLLTLLVFFHIKLKPCSLFNCKVVLHSAVTAFDLAIALFQLILNFSFWQKYQFFQR